MLEKLRDVGTIPHLPAVDPAASWWIDESAARELAVNLMIGALRLLVMRLHMTREECGSGLEERQVRWDCLDSFRSHRFVPDRAKECTRTRESVAVESSRSPIPSEEETG